MSKRGLSRANLIISIILVIIFAIIIILTLTPYNKTLKTIVIKTGMSLRINPESVQTNIENKEVILSITRNYGKGNLEAIKFVVKDGEDATYTEYKLTQMQENETQTFSISIKDLNLSSLKTITAIPVISINKKRVELADRSVVYDFKTKIVETIQTITVEPPIQNTTISQD